MQGPLDCRQACLDRGPTNWLAEEYLDLRVHVASLHRLAAVPKDTDNRVGDSPLTRMGRADPLVSSSGCASTPAVAHLQRDCGIAACVVEQSLQG